jgi:hypothetical protein
MGQRSLRSVSLPLVERETSRRLSLEVACVRDRMTTFVDENQHHSGNLGHTHLLPSLNSRV